MFILDAGSMPPVGRTKPQAPVNKAETPNEPIIATTKQSSATQDSFGQVPSNSIEETNYFLEKKLQSSPTPSNTLKEKTAGRHEKLAIPPAIKNPLSLSVEQKEGTKPLPPTIKDDLISSRETIIEQLKPSSSEFNKDKK